MQIRGLIYISSTFRGKSFMKTDSFSFSNSVQTETKLCQLKATFTALNVSVNS